MGGRSLCPFIRSLVRKEGRKEGRIVLRYQHSGEEDEERRRRRLIMGAPRGNTVYGKVLIDMHSHHIILCGTIQVDALSANVVAGSSDRKEGGRVGLFKGWRLAAPPLPVCVCRDPLCSRLCQPASQPTEEQRLGPLSAQPRCGPPFLYLHVERKSSVGGHPNFLFV